jgi:hypothetical protein
LNQARAPAILPRPGLLSEPPNLAEDPMTYDIVNEPDRATGNGEDRQSQSGNSWQPAGAHRALV